jgi:hypothetical protein
MAIVITEIFGSNSGTEAKGYKSTDSLQFILRGENDKDSAIVAMLAHLDSMGAGSGDIWRGLHYDSLDFEQPAYAKWRFTSNYIEGQRKDEQHRLATDTYKIAFSTTGAKSKIFQSLNTTVYTKTGETAPDFGGAVNVDKNRNPQGAEITVPSLTFTITYKKARGLLGWPWVRTIAALTGSTNAQTFHGFPIGTVEFLGCDGSQQIVEDPELVFNFSTEPDLTGLTYGEVDPVTKPGKDFLWFWYDTEDDLAAGELVPRPQFVFVEQLLPRGDFSLFGIGGT